MEKYLLILVMLISMIGYVVGLYGFFHNLNFIFQKITISPWMIIQGLFPIQSLIMDKKSILFWNCWCINCASNRDDIRCCKSIANKCQ